MKALRKIFVSRELLNKLQAFSKAYKTIKIFEALVASKKDF